MHSIEASKQATVQKDESLITSSTIDSNHGNSGQSVSTSTAARLALEELDLGSVHASNSLHAPERLAGNADGSTLGTTTESQSETINVTPSNDIPVISNEELQAESNPKPITLTSALKDSLSKLNKRQIERVRAHLPQVVSNMWKYHSPRIHIHSQPFTGL